MLLLQQLAMGWGCCCCDAAVGDGVGIDGRDGRQVVMLLAIVSVPQLEMRLEPQLAMYPQLAMLLVFQLAMGFE